MRYSNGVHQLCVSKGLGLLKVDLEHPFQYELELEQIVHSVEVELVDKAVGHLMSNCVVLY